MKYLPLLGQLVGLFIFMQPTIAQIDESDTSKVQVRASLTGKFQTGNVKLLSIKSRLDLTTQLGRACVLKSQNKSLYQEFSGRRADNDLSSRNFLYFQPDQRVYPLAMFFASSNFRRQVDSRYLSGLGLTYQLLRKKQQVIKITFSSFYEETVFDASNFNLEQFNNQEKISLWRWAVYLHGYHPLAENKLFFHYEAVVEPSYDNISNFRAELETGFNYQVWKGLSFLAAYRYTYEDLVALGVQQGDGLLTFGLTYYLKK